MTVTRIIKTCSVAVLAGVLFFLPLLWWQHYQNKPQQVLGEVAEATSPTPIIVAGVVPHHDLALDFSEDLFALASKQNFTRVLLISPQHYPTGIPVVASANFPALEGIARDDESIHADHGIANHLPFIDRYLPHAQVLALTIDSKIDAASFERLVQQVTTTFGSETLIVGSVDFSHNLPYLKMLEHDAQMRAWLESDSPASHLRGLDDSYLDSWPTLTLITQLANKRRANLQIADYSNAAEKLRDYTVPIPTSYFYLQFVID